MLALDQRVEVGPDDVAHRQEELPLGLAGLVDREDARVVETRRQPGFALEAFAERLVVGELRRDEFERDRSLEAELGGAVDHAHPAARDECIDPVAPEHCARLKACIQTRHAPTVPPFTTSS